MTDLLSGFLEALSPRCYVTTGFSARTGLAWLFPGFDGLKLISVERGAFFCSPGEGVPRLELAPGDCIALLRPHNYVLATSADAEAVLASTVPYRREHGLAQYGGDDVITFAGKMMPDPAVAELFFAALPAHFVIPREAGGESIGRLMREIHAEREEERPGGEWAVKRLIDLVMLSVLRFALEHESVVSTGLFRAMRAPGLRRALIGIHDAPERAWTLADLAHEAGMSRSRFAEHFRTAMGVPPLEYLMRWRVRLAVRRLRDTDEPVKAVAAKLGFSSANTFSNAFRRIEGMSPVESREKTRELLSARLGPYAPPDESGF
ncbi:AraC family transcriptional regulator [Sutterella sp.]|uniref:AraC family transcriptional regulator n=1 Tax=Sutterella sp. TaxID=1981025 RepID=UPI0026E085AC|nr:AraC family transcriptional regulator [Sutterella sp.]MDO5530823.1 AraC family transcriptional regulator [Sutterella sp.]